MNPPSAISVNSVSNHQDLVIQGDKITSGLQGRIQIPGDKSISHRSFNAERVSRSSSVKVSASRSQPTIDTADASLLEHLD